MGDAERQITALLHEYAFRLDSGDLDGVAAMFEHADLGTFGSEERRHGIDGARANYDPVILYADGTPRTMHVITNVTIDVDPSQATAAARSYFTVFQCAPSEAYQPIVGGAYHDRFESVDGAWRFSQRLFEPVLVGDLSRHLSFDFGLSSDG